MCEQPWRMRKATVWPARLHGLWMLLHAAAAELAAFVQAANVLSKLHCVVLSVCAGIAPARVTMFTRALVQTSGADHAVLRLRARHQAVCQYCGFVRAVKQLTHLLPSTGQQASVSRQAGPMRRQTCCFRWPWANRHHNKQRLPAKLDPLPDGALPCVPDQPTCASVRLRQSSTCSTQVRTGQSRSRT